MDFFASREILLEINKKNYASAEGIFFLDRRQYEQVYFFIQKAILPIIGAIWNFA